MHCRDIDTSTCGSILGAVDSTSKAITNRCPTHSMAYCLFSAFALGWFIIQYTNVLWWTRQRKSHYWTSVTPTHTQHCNQHWLYCECSHTWWLGTCTHHCHLQSAWTSPSFCAGHLPQRSHTALVLGPYGQRERQPKQQSRHSEGESARVDCDTNVLPLTSCGWIIHFNGNTLFLNTPQDQALWNLSTALPSLVHATKSKIRHLPLNYPAHLYFIYLPNPPPTTTHIPSYTAIFLLKLSDAQLRLHEPTNWATIKSMYTCTILSIT